MINIGIVDDEKRAADGLYYFVDMCCKEENIECKIHIYLSSIQMLSQAELLNIVFLDIEMPDTDGIETGRRLNKINPRCTIIMATVNRERYKESFKINAFRYITKPFEKGEIYEAVKSYIEKITGQKEIDVFYDRIPYKIMEKDICYIKAYNGYTLIYSEKKEYRSELSLGEYENQLDKRIFFRISRSCLVNLLKVEKFQNNKIYIGEEVLKISRRSIKEFKVKLMKADAEYSLGVKV